MVLTVCIAVEMHKISRRKGGGDMYNKCQKCGKKLTDPESMRRGYGPECWSEITGIPISEVKPAADQEQIKGQMSIADFPEYMPEGGAV